MGKILLLAFLICCSFLIKAQHKNSDSASLFDLKASVRKLYIPYQPKIVYFNPFYDDIPFTPFNTPDPISFVPATTICIGDSCNSFTAKSYSFPSYTSTAISFSNSLNIPAYTQGFFCDFEDHINRKRQFRIDFSVKY